MRSCPSRHPARKPSISGLVPALSPTQYPANLLPKRVAQLDPFWAKGSKDAPWRGADVREIARKTIGLGVVWEMYKTSALLDLAGARKDAMTQLIGRSQVVAHFISMKQKYLEQEGAWHGFAPLLYFMSFGVPPPSACGAAAACSERASATDEDVRTLMGHGARYKQVEGRMTPTTADDRFELEQKNKAALPSSMAEASSCICNRISESVTIMIWFTQRSLHSPRRRRH